MARNCGIQRNESVNESIGSEYEYDTLVSFLKTSLN